MTQAVERRAAALGVVAGTRSQLPMALLSLLTPDGKRAESVTTPTAGFLRSPLARTILMAAAAGEMIADKLPIVPSRLAPGPFLGRALFGAIAGAALVDRSGGDRMVGAAAGCTGAVIGTVLFGHLRVELVRLTKLPDLPFALAEDLLAVLLGRWAITSLPREAPPSE